MSLHQPEMARIALEHQIDTLSSESYHTHMELVDNINRMPERYRAPLLTRLVHHMAHKMISWNAWY
jgi:hypothetical protein